MAHSFKLIQVWTKDRLAGFSSDGGLPLLALQSGFGQTGLYFGFELWLLDGLT